MYRLFNKNVIVSIRFNNEIICIIFLCESVLGEGFWGTPTWVMGALVWGILVG
jgi:hypothetical protein